ncbi:MAG TPA: phage antirepressor N-terminal domain-containing protein [Fluviicoccus sp.]|nr:phage antirepressor N-terminal domain-containing protein [Fluviicoccus sp.]
MNNNALAVHFHGAQLYIINQNGEPFTPMRPIVQGMGLDWPSQYKKMKRNEKRWGVVMMTTPTEGDEQESLCIPLRKLFGWLTGIDAGRVSPEIRETVIRYQDECDEVLYHHWRARMAVPIYPHKVIQDEAWRIADGNSTIKADLYRRVKQKYGVARITEIPDELCPSAAEYIRTLEGDYIGKPVVTSTDPARVAHAYAVAAEVASIASRTVFEAVLAGDEAWMNRRWLFCLSQNAAGQRLPFATALATNAFITSFEQLPGMILEANGPLASNRDLLALASACNQKLTQRLGNGAGLPPPRH